MRIEKDSAHAVVATIRPARLRSTVRRIAIINQKGGVGKTTTTANLGAALALLGRRVVVVDMDAQANLSLSLGVEAPSGSPTSYAVLTGGATFAQALRDTATPGLRLLPANIDLSGAELELASAMGREFVLRDALQAWVEEETARTGAAPADFVLFDCPPSLGLLSINALAAAAEVLITIQTEFLALQGMSKLVEIVQLLKRRLNPELRVSGILPCLYDSRLRLAREVLGEIRNYFRDQVLPHPIGVSVKLAEAPSFGQTIFEYAPGSSGARDYERLARTLLGAEDAGVEARAPAATAEKPVAAQAVPAPAPVKPAKTKKAPRAKKPVEREVKLVPAPRANIAKAAKAPAARTATQAERAAERPAPPAAQRKPAEPAPRIARDAAPDDLPELPPDAFEILSSLPGDS